MRWSRSLAVAVETHPAVHDLNPNDVTRAVRLSHAVRLPALLLQRRRVEAEARVRAALVNGEAAVLLVVPVRP